MTRRHESTSFRTTIIVLGFAVATILLFIVMSSIMAPERLEPPPISTISYEKPPDAEVPDFAFDSVPGRYVANADPNNVRVPLEREPYHDETYAPITGTVIDAETREPIYGVDIYVQWNYRDEEKELINRLQDSIHRTRAFDVDDRGRRIEVAADPSLYTEEDVALLAEYDIEKTTDIARINSETSNHQRVYTDAEGRFTIYVPFDRVYALHAKQQHFKAKRFHPLIAETGTTPPPMLIELSRGASISGRVFDLANNSGIPAMSLSVSALELRPTDPNNAQYDNSNITTDKNGDYFIGGLEPGDYEIRVRYQFSRYRPGKVLPFKKLAVNDELEAVQNIDFGLRRAGVVWGYVRNPEEDVSLTANLLLVSSDNMITQGINAALNEMSDNRRTFSAYSDEQRDGYYEMVGVPINEEWRVYAMTQDAAPQLSDPFVLTESSPDIRVDINLYSGTKVTGRVIDEDGVGISGADVYCIPGFADFFSPMNTAKTFRDGKTDEWGAFELDDLPNGNYQIFAFAKGYKVSTRGTPVASDGYNDVSGILVKLHNTEHGNHEIYGRVTDTKGRPVTNANVEVGGFSMDAFMNNAETNFNMTTDSSGQYRFTGVPLGKYMMNVTHSQFPDMRVTKVWLDKPTDVTLNLGSRIAGIVYDGKTNRRYRDHFQVYAMRQAEDDADTSNDQPLDMIVSILERFDQTNANVDTETGEFDMFVQPGTYQIRAEAGTKLSDPVLVTIDDGQEVNNVELFLGGAGGIIDGWVSVLDGSNPQGARVMLSKVGEELIAGLELDTGHDETYTVSEDGRFVFENIPGGTYRVVSTHPSYASAMTDKLELGDGVNEHTVTLVLGRGGSIEGYVNNRGRPVPNATVLLLGTIDSNAVSTDNAGFFYMDNVGAGEHKIIAIAAASIANIASGNIDTDLGTSVSVNAGRTTRVDLELSRGVE